MSSLSARRSALVALVAVIAATVAPTTSASADPGTGFLTGAGPYITLASGAPSGSSVLPILTVGEDAGVPEFRFEGLPDGIGIVPGEGSTVDVFVAHEQTTVPFFGEADFQDASVSRLTLETTPGPGQGSVLDASVAVSPDDGFLRFCSASVAGPAEGFSSYTFFTGEEANDIVDVPPGAPYGADPALGDQRQAGYAIALDAETGDYTHVAGMGRLNHENTIAVPGGWNQHALLTTDDTFNAPSAQLYLYLANHERHIFEDKGSLWAFRVTHDDGPLRRNDPFNGANDYLDIEPGDDWRGEFIRVPKEIARGETDLAPQDALEQWSNEHNVFQFIRLEDLAYDVDNPRVVYAADTGRSRIVPDPDTGRLVRGPSGTVGQADGGRIFRFEFDAQNPRKVTSFSILAQGDDPGAADFVPFVSPDNMDTSAASLMVQEDTDEAKIWRQDLGSRAWSVVATVNDPDGESSGIVDASAWFGSGSWLLDVQAHGSNVDEQQQGDVLRKREDGQLLLMTIPGS